VSKKYKGELCVYCSRERATTRDHVFARNFFLVKRRDDLPQAPACTSCNRQKSEIEHYLATVFGFGGRHTDAVENFETMVPRRLEKNVKLFTQIQQGYSGEKIPLVSGQIEKWLALVTKGLLWHHWKTVLDPDEPVAAILVQSKGVGELRGVLSRLKVVDHVVVDLGVGTFRYVAARTADSPHSSFWWFSLYGGIQFADEQRNPGGKDSVLLSVTGRLARVVKGEVQRSPTNNSRSENPAPSVRS
jgi:hypothetical protein